eukprot:CAMPEP_0198350804 /NCGR_PEP_ID=MMETSP1450-20131203/100380_1 /TAXON_ID=753684 ORGANISM="Madagascaria erythrocladiodes, Strain CCMP3234" /NCGR_SAMPLE_ID=MMETSP1450 /ASSEMBLY_ACC=CAM_ASM_001115 /LENGTH=33 /DNA_ID= /DNA_START= /DNA_END= /DNA_ORIENTATION=
MTPSKHQYHNDAAQIPKTIPVHGNSISSTGLSI